MFDVLIKNGRIVDGTGNPWYYGDVGIVGEEIKEIGKIEGDAKRTIDARRRVVCPGFADPHSHPDYEMLSKEKFERKDWSFQNMLFQGATTLIGGNCGESVLPNSKILKEYFIEENFPEKTLIPAEWSSLKEFAELAYKVGLGVNVTLLTGHAFIRKSVLPPYPKNKKASEEQIKKMREMVERDMRDGAIGLSSGLSYVPNRFADTEEIVRLAEVVGKHGGIYASHIRGCNSLEAFEDGIREIIEVGRRTGIPVHIAHLSCFEGIEEGKTPSVLKLINKAREDGVDITFDVVAYGGHTYPIPFVMCAMVGPPPCIISSKEELARSWKDPKSRERVWEMIVNVEDGCKYDYFSTIMLNPASIITHSGSEELDGKTLAEIAKSKDPRDILNVLVKLFLEDCPGRINFPINVDFPASRKEVAMLFDSPLSMPSSDSAGVLVPSPNNYGTMPRFLRERLDRGVRLEEVIRKVSSLPLRRFKLFDRGLLNVGMKADICILDPEKVKDNCTFKDPTAKPSGIDYVLVNGSIVIDNGELTDARPGKILFLKRDFNRI